MIQTVGTGIMNQMSGWNTMIWKEKTNMGKQPIWVTDPKKNKEAKKALAEGAKVMEAKYAESVKEYGFMKLTKEEHQSLIDSRLVDLEVAISVFKDGQPIVNDAKNIERLNTIVSQSELLLEAYQAYVDAEEEELAEEAEEDYKKNFLGEWDEK